MRNAYTSKTPPFQEVFFNPSHLDGTRFGKKTPNMPKHRGLIPNFKLLKTQTPLLLRKTDIRSRNLSLSNTFSIPIPKKPIEFLFNNSNNSLRKNENIHPIHL
jgi:hypothetical protein